jgi:hypothetical protein
MSRRLRGHQGNDVMEAKLMPLMRPPARVTFLRTGAAASGHGRDHGRGLVVLVPA